MATAKKGKKSSKPKSGSKKKKSNNKMNFFSKFMLTLLLIAVFAGAIFYTLNNFSKTKTTTPTISKTSTKVTTPTTNTKPDPTPAPSKVQTPAPSKASNEEKTAELKQEFKELKTMTGSWHSSEQGAFLTMDEYGYRIDCSNVHASKPITGNYRIENNLIVFTSDGSECKNEDGTYRINFFKKNISLTCKSDNCVNRRTVYGGPSKESVERQIGIVNAYIDAQK
jgi:hypothetical protein